MKLVSLSLLDFLSYSGEHHIPLEDFGTAVIVGDNGVGKSSLPEGIRYSIFGESRAASEDELSHGYDIHTKKWLVKKFGATLRFKLNSSLYEIARYRKPSGGTLTFKNLSNGKEYTGNSIKETQAAINEFLGMDDSSFMASVVMEQDEYDAFMKMSPSESKQVLMNILGLNSFEEKRKLAATREVEVSLRIAVVDSALISKGSEVEAGANIPVEIEDNQTNLSVLNVALKAKKVQYESSLGEFAAIKAAYEESSKKSKRKVELEQTLNSSRAAMERSDGIVKTRSTLIPSDIVISDYSLDPLRVEMDEVRVGLTESTKAHNAFVTTKLTQADVNLKMLRGERDRLLTEKQNASTGSLCLLGKEECHSKLVERIEGNLKEIVEKGKNAKVEYDVLFESSRQESEKIHLLTERMGLLGKLIQAHEALADYEVKKAEFSRVEKDYAEIARDLNFNSGGISMDDFRAKDLEIKTIKQAIEGYERDVLNLTTYLGQLAERMERIEREKIEIEKIKKEKALLLEDKGLYALLTKAFSKDGIPALLIESLVPALEADANDLLDRMTGGRIRLQFYLQKKLKSGGFSESFEIFVTDEKGTRALRMYSGGEKFRIIFAIHSAFSKYLTYRSGTQLRFLFLDEPAGLDQGGIEKLVEVLSVLRESYDQIFVITHLRELMEHFPQSILVERSGGSSHLTIGQSGRGEEL